MCCWHNALDLNGFDLALLHSPCDCGGSEVETSIFGMGPSAKLLWANWLKNTVPILLRGPPVQHISRGDILAGTIPPQLVNFCFVEGGILEHTIRDNFSLCPKWSNIQSRLYWNIFWQYKYYTFFPFSKKVRYGSYSNICFWRTTIFGRKERFCRLDGELWKPRLWMYLLDIKRWELIICYKGLLYSLSIQLKPYPPKQFHERSSLLRSRPWSRGWEMIAPPAMASPLLYWTKAGVDRRLRA
jgi:hypothetical protein